MLHMQYIYNTQYNIYIYIIYLKFDFYSLEPVSTAKVTECHELFKIPLMFQIGPLSLG